MSYDKGSSEGSETIIHQTENESIELRKELQENKITTGMKNSSEATRIKKQ